MEPLARYRHVRENTEAICKPLDVEDHQVQPAGFVSPPKWHLAHTTWFFEVFILQNHMPDYKLFNPDYLYIFNSYYESLGPHSPQGVRGHLSRPSVKNVYAYRRYVDDAMGRLLSEENIARQVLGRLELGLQHEQQHQELLWTDIKYILGHQPFFPALYREPDTPPTSDLPRGYVKMPGGIYTIGYQGEGFCFDNEQPAHQVYLQDYHISHRLVTNREYAEFIRMGGYKDVTLWHSDGWEWIGSEGIEKPLYWHYDAEKQAWNEYTWSGISPLDQEAPVRHISYYEAHAYAQWKDMRLPTEAEWEAAAAAFHWGERWEWTQSAYLPYPGFKARAGALGEYNGKFMVNQMVLRGAATVTAPGHSRSSYRNFFRPWQRWQFTGIRLAY